MIFIFNYFPLFKIMEKLKIISQHKNLVRVKCSKNHNYPTKIDNLKDICLACVRTKNKYTFLKKKFLDIYEITLCDNFINNNTMYNFQCSNGHLFNKTFIALTLTPECPFCKTINLKPPIHKKNTYYSELVLNSNNKINDDISNIDINNVMLPISITNSMELDKINNIALNKINNITLNKINNITFNEPNSVSFVKKNNITFGNFSTIKKSKLTIDNKKSKLTIDNKKSKLTVGNKKSKLIIDNLSSNVNLVANNYSDLVTNNYSNLTTTNNHSDLFHNIVDDENIDFTTTSDMELFDVLNNNFDYKNL